MNEQNTGIKHIMNLPGGMNAVQLQGPDIIFRENQKLNIGLLYRNVLDSANDTEYYTLRTGDNRARVMIAVKNGAVQMCRGINRSRPANYMNQIITFIIGRGFDVVADMACTGIIRQKNHYYNVYDLPKKFTVWGNMDLSYAGLYHLPDMHSVIIRGNYDISGNNLTDFMGLPAEVFGDFIVRDNEFGWVGNVTPKHVHIHGQYIVGKTDRSR